MLNDPCVNLAISTRTATKGVDHLGIQVDEEQELTDIRQRLTDGNIPVTDKGETLCCYAQSDKTWVLDPAGVAWEAYRTMQDAEIFSTHSVQADTASCAPTLVTTPKPKNRNRKPAAIVIDGD